MIYSCSPSERVRLFVEVILLEYRCISKAISYWNMLLKLYGDEASDFRIPIEGRSTAMSGIIASFGQKTLGKPGESAHLLEASQVVLALPITIYNGYSEHCRF